MIGLTLVVSGESYFLTLFTVIVFYQMFEGIALGTCIADLSSSSISLFHKLALATVFSFITLIGMAIGTGVLDQFNGNSPRTIVAIGKLDAIECGNFGLGRDCGDARERLDARIVAACGDGEDGVAMTALVSGMTIISILGKWAEESDMRNMVRGLRRKSRGIEDSRVLDVKMQAILWSSYALRTALHACLMTKHDDLALRIIVVSIISHGLSLSLRNSLLPSHMEVFSYCHPREFLARKCKSVH